MLTTLLHYFWNTILPQIHHILTQSRSLNSKIDHEVLSEVSHFKNLETYNPNVQNGYKHFNGESQIFPYNHKLEITHPKCTIIPTILLSGLNELNEYTHVYNWATSKHKTDNDTSTSHVHNIVGAFTNHHLVTLAVIALS